MKAGESQERAEEGTGTDLRTAIQLETTRSGNGRLG